MPRLDKTKNESVKRNVGVVATSTENKISKIYQMQKPLRSFLYYSLIWFFYYC